MFYFEYQHFIFYINFNYLISYVRIYIICKNAKFKYWPFEWDHLQKYQMFHIVSFQYKICLKWILLKVNKNNLGSTASKPDWCDCRPEVFSIIKGFYCDNCNVSALCLLWPGFEYLTFCMQGERQILKTDSDSSTAKRLGMALRTDSPCLCGSVKLKNPHCYMDMNAKLRPKFSAVHCDCEVRVPE